MQANGIELWGQRVLVRSPNWLGDAVMTLPAVRRLREWLPAGGTMWVLAPESLEGLWRRVEGVCGVVAVDRNVWITACAVAELACTGAVIFPNSPRTALEAFLGRVPFRGGFAGGWRRSLLTAVVERSRRMVPRHQAEDYADLVEALAGREGGVLPELPRLQGIVPEGLPGGYLAVCPGAEYGPAKRWGAARFAAAAERLREALGVAEVVVLGGPKDGEEAARVAGNVGAGVRNLTGQTGFDAFLRWLAGARLVVCNDSGAMHLAALLRVPCVAVFGSTEPRLTGPLGKTVAVVREQVACSPCFMRECPLDLRCMSRVTVDQVVARGLEVAG